ncbi:hypothetical protein C7212DRAFT_320954, partial [Tuber magnatum]
MVKALLDFALTSSALRLLLALADAAVVGAGLASFSGTAGGGGDISGCGGGIGKKVCGSIPAAARWAWCF